MTSTDTGRRALTAIVWHDRENAAPAEALAAVLSRHDCLVTTYAQEFTGGDSFLARTIMRVSEADIVVIVFSRESKSATYPALATMHAAQTGPHRGICVGVPFGHGFDCADLSGGLLIPMSSGRDARVVAGMVLTLADVVVGRWRTE